MVEACRRHLTYVGASSDLPSVHWSDCFDYFHFGPDAEGWCRDQISAAIRYGLPLTAEALLRSQLPIKRGGFYLSCALHGCPEPSFRIDTWRLTWDNETGQLGRPPMIYMLLSNGCDPNEVFRDRIVWQTLVDHFFDSYCHIWHSELGGLCPHDFYEGIIQLDDCAQVFEHFVNFGADPDVRIQSCSCMKSLPEELHLRDAIRYAFITGPQSNGFANPPEVLARWQSLGKRLM